MKDYEKFAQLLNKKTGGKCLLDKMAKEAIKDFKHVTYDELMNAFINVFGLYHQWIDLEDGQTIELDFPS